MKPQGQLNPPKKSNGKEAKEAKKADAPAGWLSDLPSIESEVPYLESDTNVTVPKERIVPAVLLGILIVATLIRLAYIPGESVWFDEVVTI